MKFKTTIIAAIIILISCCLYRMAVAQTDPNLNKEVEVVRAYQPTVDQAMKILSSPKIVDTVNYTPTFDYKIRSTTIAVDRTINQLPAVQLGSAPKAESNTGYLRAAYGNAWTPTAEFFLSTAPTKNSEFGMHLFHFSTQPQIKLMNELKVKTPFSNNLASLFARNHFRGAILEWDASYQRERFNYYGFPHDDSLVYRANEPISTTLSARQVFNTASTNFRLTNTNQKKRFDHNTAIGYHYFWNATGQQMHHGALDGRFKYRLDRFDLLSGLKAGYNHQRNIDNVYNNNNAHQYLFAAIDPQIAFSGKLWEVRAGANISIIIDDDTTAPFHLSPKTYFAFTPIQGILTLFAGTDGNLKYNHYSQSMKDNPFLNYKSDLLPTETQIALFGGLKGKFSRKISYLFDVQYAIAKNELFYYQTITEYENSHIVAENTFNINYNNLNTLRFGGQIRYSSVKFNLDLSGNYYLYNSETAGIITDRPEFDARLTAGFKITDRISAELGATVIGPRSAAVEKRLFSIEPTTGLYNPQPAVTVLNPNMGMIIDTHLEVNYQFNKKLGFFLSVNNILNKNHQQWYGYNSPGLLIQAGARFVF